MAGCSLSTMIVHTRSFDTDKEDDEVSTTNVAMATFSNVDGMDEHKKNKDVQE